MTLTLLTDKNNDLYLDVNGNIAVGTGIKAVTALCEFAAKTRLGEMIFQANEGLPNFQVIWNGSPNPAQFEAALRQTLINVPDVSEIINITMTINSNSLNYVAIIKTIYGNTVINGAI